MLAPFQHGRRFSFADVKAGDLRGTVFSLNADGQRSAVTGATVTLNGPSLSNQTVTDERGGYSFGAVTPGSYRIDVKALGLTVSNAVTVVSGTALDIPIQLKIDAVKESVTVKENDEQTISTESSARTVINRSTVLNAPNK